MATQTASKNSAKTDAEKAASKAEKSAKAKALFVKTAPKRMTKALTAIRNVGRMAPSSSYEFDTEQVDKMLRALQSQVAETERLFRARLEGKTAAKVKDEFSF